RGIRYFYVTGVQTCAHPNFMAGKSIIPIQQITDTTNRITKKNLNERVLLPENKDELYTLSTSINDLLRRIQDAMEREKQFTSDRSEERRVGKESRGQRKRSQ